MGMDDTAPKFIIQDTISGRFTSGPLSWLEANEKAGPFETVRRVDEVEMGWDR